MQAHPTSDAVQSLWALWRSAPWGIIATAGRPGHKSLSPSARRKGDLDVPFRILSTATLRLFGVYQVKAGLLRRRLLTGSKGARGHQGRRRQAFPDRMTGLTAGTPEHGESRIGNIPQTCQASPGKLLDTVTKQR